MSHRSTRDKHCTVGALHLCGVPGARFGEQARLVGEAVATHAACV